MKQETGIVYIAVGSDSVKDAERSARTAKRLHPDLPICLFSDVSSQDPVFDIRLEIASPHRRSKPECMALSPFNRTLYLDNDTRVIGSMYDPFGLLDRYDFAACHVENRHTAIFMTTSLNAETGEDGLIGLSSGVIYYRLNDNVRIFLKAWASEIREPDPKLQHRIGLECLLDIPELNVIVLPPEYNVRSLRWLLFHSSDETKARLLHLPWYKSSDSVVRRLLRTIKTLSFNPVNAFLMVRILFK